MPLAIPGRTKDAVVSLRVGEPDLRHGDPPDIWSPSRRVAARVAHRVAEGPLDEDTNVETLAAEFFMSSRQLRRVVEERFAERITREDYERYRDLYEEARAVRGRLSGARTIV